jgi:integrase
VAGVELVVGAFSAILGETGLRLSEGLRLKWYDLDVKERILTVSSESKSGKVRHVPLTDFALEWLQAIPRTVGVDWVFLRTRTQPWRDPRGAFTKGTKEAGLEWVGFHGLRHFRASQWVRCGVDLRTVQELLGHATVTTTQRYAHFAPSHARNEVERVSVLERSAIERDDSGTTLIN